MGNSKSKELSLPVSTDDSIILPVPLYLTSPHCESIQSITYNQTFEFEHNSDTYNDAQFLFEIPLSNQVNDCWNSFHPQKFGLNKSPEMMHTIHRISKHSDNKNSSSDNTNDWLSVFGTQIIHKGEYKIWKIKIYPRNDSINHIIQYNSFPIADVVIGIVDNDTINEITDKQNVYNGGFWMKPFFGYGFYGFNGKKFHNQRRGKQYNNKYNVSDIITVELDLQCNQLKFYINDMDCGLAYEIEGNRNYNLALSLCDDNYDVQICNYQ